MNNKMTSPTLQDRCSSRRQCALAAAVLAAVFSAGAAAQVHIAITFDGKGCPLPGVEEAVVDRGKKIYWQAYDTEGQPSRQEFRIYFDPLKGSTLKAPQGKVDHPVDSNASTVEYKYTIVGDGCEDSPLDPRIRVNK